MIKSQQANRIKHLVNGPDIILTEGAIIERIRRASPGLLDRDLLNAPLVYRDDGRRLLAVLHRQYLDIGSGSGLPLLVFSDTWRANRERLERAGMAGKDVNADCVRFLQELVAEKGGFAGRVAIAGLIGCRGDAYRPEEALTESDAASFHAFQVNALADAGVDLLFAATVPSVREAAGMAAVMARTGAPYAVSFVFNRNGQVLDGTPVHEAISMIDGRVSPPPLFYMANCCHPVYYAAAMRSLMREDAALIPRIIGLQANTSLKEAAELDNLPSLDTEEPETFAGSMLGLYREFGTRILGGCCGTNDRHMEAIAAGAAALSRP